MTQALILESSPQFTSVDLMGLYNVSLPITPWAVPGFKVEADPNDKYIVASIDGLDPPDVNVAIARTPSGGKYQGRQFGDRELVFLIELNPDYDAGETPKLLRDNLYTMLSTGYDPKVLIRLMVGPFAVAQAVAYVTKFEQELNSKDPFCQITFTTLEPTFKALGPTTYAPDELDLNYPNIYNDGTAESGFQFQVKFTDSMNHWYINQAEDQSIGMRFEMDFNENDILSVSTVPGNQYVHWQKRRGKVKNMMGILTDTSEWITLHPGDNRFVVPPKDKWQWKGNLSFTVRYWGV